MINNNRILKPIGVRKKKGKSFKAHQRQLIYENDITHKDQSMNKYSPVSVKSPHNLVKKKVRQQWSGKNFKKV